MPSRLYLLCIAGLFLTLYACSSHREPGNKVEDYNPVMKSLFRTDSGLFRGANLGMKVAEIKALENNQKPDEEEANYLSYSLAFRDTFQCSYYYDFEENGMDEIGINIYRTKSKDFDWLFTNIKQYFTKKYGSPQLEKNLLVWYVKNQGKEGAQITLSDESRDYGYGELTLTIFPFQSQVDPKEKEATP
jgi:hypothetical protein